MIRQLLERPSDDSNLGIMNIINTKFLPNENLIKNKKIKIQVKSLVRSQVMRFVVGTIFNLFVTASFSFKIFPENCEKKYSYKNSFYIPVL